MSVETEIVTISITQESAAIASAGFGTALILSHNATFSERVRYYDGVDGVAEDWSTTSPEYRSALALFGQSKKPTQIAIGRATDSVPTLKYTISSPTARASDSRAYKINVVGQGFTDDVAAYTTDSTPTAAKIHNGLVTDLNTVVGKNYLAAFALLVYADHTFTAATSDIATSATHGLLTGDGPFRLTSSGTLPAGLALATDYWIIKIDTNTYKFASTLANALAGTAVDVTDTGTGTHTIADVASTARPSDPFTVTGSAPGNWFSLELVDVTALSTALSHSGDPTADLDAIELEEPGWYFLLTNYNSPSYVLAAATWIEAHTKIYLVDVPETGAINTAVVDGTDTLTQLHTAAFSRTAGAYHHRPATFFSAAWAGRVGPVDPGGDTWALKQLVGVGMPSKLSTTNRVNLRARKANFITTGFGKNLTFDGTTADGDFIDVTRGLDWLNDNLTISVGGVLTEVDKVPYSNPGVTVVVNQVKASLDRAVQRGILRADPKPTVTAPKVEDIDPAVRGARLLPDIKFTGQTEGAIHKVAIAGLVSL